MTAQSAGTLDTETLEQIKGTIRRLVHEKLIPIEREVAENDAMPTWVVDEFRNLGLFGISIPEEYGGLGLSISEEAQLMLELAQAAPAFRSIIGTNNGIGSQGLVINGTQEQKEKYLPKIATGEIITSFALTEPNSGSDAQSIRTSARRKDDGYILNGTKRFITNAPKADLFTVMACTAPRGKGSGHISAFLVPRDAPGLSVMPHDKKMGQQGSHTADVVFEDCYIPAENLLGGTEGLGFKTAMKVLDRGRLHISAVCCGLAERLINEALTYALEREQFGQPLAEFQLVQAMLADSRTEASAARALTLETARRYDLGENVSMDAASSKYFASEMVGRVADRAVQIHGGAGYMSEYAVERLYRDVRLFRIYEGTSQIQQLVIARAMIRGTSA